jgi:subtilisin family serine protease
MITNNNTSARAYESLVQKAIFFVSLTLSTFTFAADSNSAKDMDAFGSIMNGDINAASRPMDQNETQVIFLKDGKVAGEATYQTEEVDIIVQFDTAPIFSQESISGAVKVEKLNNLRQTMSLAKTLIVQAENAVLSQNGKASKLDKDIIKREYFRVFNGVAARVQKNTIKDIEKIPGVKKVWRDNKVQALDDSSNAVIGAPQVWSNLGVTGANIVVAILDTGIDYRHPDLGGCLGSTCKVIAGHDFVNNDSDPMDDHGHGTHCAGIVAAKGTLHGVAPDAKLMAGKVLSSSGSGSYSGIIAGIEWATDPDGNPGTNDGADVISMSLGGSGSPDDPLAQAVDTAVAAGVVVVVAAGNTGPNYESVQSPGVARNAITVGATDNNDQIASFSSRGPVSGTWQIKPEVMAPGVNITSTYPNNSYASMSGTSMATPHVAGAVALLLQQYPYADPEWIKNALMQKAVDLTKNTYAQGSGRIAVYASATIKALVSTGGLNLGADDIAQPTFQWSKPLTLTNSSTVSQTYNLSIPSSLPSGVTASVTPSSLTLAAGETKDFTFELHVNNSVTPNSMMTLDLSQPYNFEGRIRATTGTDTIGVPFTFLKAPTLTVQFDDYPLFTIIHPSSGGGTAKRTTSSTDYTTLVPGGSYNVVTWFYNNKTSVQENVAVSTKTTVPMSSASAIYPVSIVPTGATGESISVQNGLQFTYFEVKNSGYVSLITSSGSQAVQYFSPMSDNYLYETSFMVNSYPASGPTYMFHAYANGASGPVNFTNTSANFRHVTHRHHVDSGLTTVYPLTASAVQYTSGTSINNSYSYFGYSCSNVPLAAPFQEESYLLPPPYAGFHTGYLKKIVYASTSSTMCSGSWPIQYVSPLLRARDAVTLDGFANGSYFPSPPFSSTETVLHSGIGPFSWYGKFYVYSSGYVFAVADREYGYASQARDVRPPTASGSFPYELYRGSTLIQSGTFAGSGGSITSLTPDVYTLKLTMNNFTVNGAPGLATASTTFNMNAWDPAPPTLSQFRLKKNGVPTNTISGGELLQFEVIDENSSIASASVQYNRGDGWATLSRTNPSGTLYEATMPAPLVPNTPVSIRIVATDTYNNSFTFETQVASSVAPKPIVDFNLDGKPDILWRNAAAGDNYVWYMDGVTVIGGANLPTVADQNWKVVGIADFNNDSKPDILWRNVSGGENYVWYLNGVAVIGGANLPTVADQSWKVVGVADFNNDSKPDILWRNLSGGENYVWYMDGVTVIGGANLPTVADQNWKVVGVADFNNDSKPDILWRNVSGGENYVWYLNGVAVIGGANLPTVADQSWKVVGVADFNNDSKPDVQWRNVSGGENYVWYMDGVTVTGGANLPTVADQNWTIVP